ncbi:MAG: hemin-degrading factor [Gammaproteobacteria bacterium]|nr:hemin-degrading factor [Gammaproteobacteria bacterium]
MCQANDSRTSSVSPEALKRRWDELRENRPQLRIREAASVLEVSEAELLATGCGENVTRLEAGWPVLLDEVDSLGPVMALTRNDNAVHEKTGFYLNIRLTDTGGRIQGENIDLFLDFRHWHSAFAVTEQTRQGARDSLQFFDRDGTAVHKIYMTENRCIPAYRTLIERYRSEDQSQRQHVEPPLRNIDSVAVVDGNERLGQAWHEHLIACGAVPYQSTEPLQTGRLQPSSFRRFMEKASESGAGLTVLVGNDGALQVHTGPIEKLMITGTWFNVLDDGFNLHLKEDALAELRLAERRAGNTSVNTLELYDAAGCHIAMILFEHADLGECLTMDV